MSTAETSAYEIQGQQVTFPVEVRDASGAIAGFLVSSRAANRLVGDAFEIVEFLPGRTLFMLGCIDYKDNDLGDYNEVAMNFFVREKGASRGLPWIGAWLAMAKGGLPSYSWKMPVNQSFTRDAGAIIWGFPKTVERIDFDYSQEGREGVRDRDAARRRQGAPCEPLRRVQLHRRRSARHVLHPVRHTDGRRRGQGR
jgi:hypothetical protein